jgi:hypothetical protein
MSEEYDDTEKKSRRMLRGEGNLKKIKAGEEIKKKLKNIEEERKKKKWKEKK